MGEDTIRIATIGLPNTDQRVLTSLVRLTAQRARRYEIGEAGMINAPNIVMFDGDSPPTVGKWRTEYGSRSVPSIMVSQSAVITETGATLLTRPLIASKVLNALDSIAVTRTAAPTEDVATSSEPLSARTRADEVFERLRGLSSNSLRAATSSLRALVIDDSPTVRKQLELTLREFNIDVDAVESGEDGLQQLATSRYAIVFLDVVLPGWDGYQICKTIKKDAALRDTPVVMLTSKSSPFDRIRGSLVGCDSYLTKPLDANVFHGVLKKYLPSLTSRASPNKLASA